MKVEQSLYSSYPNSFNPDSVLAELSDIMSGRCEDAIRHFTPQMGYGPDFFKWQNPYDFNEYASNIWYVITAKVYVFDSIDTYNITLDIGNGPETFNETDYPFLFDPNILGPGAVRPLLLPLGSVINSASDPLFGYPVQGQWAVKYGTGPLGLAPILRILPNVYWGQMRFNYQQSVAFPLMLPSLQFSGSLYAPGDVVGLEQPLLFNCLAFEAEIVNGETGILTDVGRMVDWGFQFQGKEYLNPTYQSAPSDSILYLTNPPT